MRSLEELLQIKDELLEWPAEDSIDIEFVIELVESNISALLGDENRVKVERYEKALKEIEENSRCNDSICERWLIAWKALHKEE